MNTNYAINIGRQLGSGGRDIGKQIAERLNISFYDKELITIASKKSGLSSKIFEEADEKAGLFYSGGLIGLRSSIIGDSYVDNFLGNESLFKIQSDVIRELNKSQSAVFVGRCADYILRNNPEAINIFISSPLDERIKRIAERHNFTLKKAKEYIEKTDKRRESFYNYYSNKKWGAATTYHLCIDSSIGIEACADFIIQYVEKKLGFSLQR